MDIAHQTEAPDYPFYIESTIPTGITIAEYRRLRPRRRPWWRRLR